MELAYCLAINMLRGFDEKDVWLGVEVPEEKEGTPLYPRRFELERLPMQALVSRFSAASGLLLVCGVLLVQNSDALARQTGLGHIFVGATLLAATTSLPEVSTTIMAARLRAYTMAISNVFGSNLIMIILLLPADIAYRPGPVLAEADASAVFAIVSGIMLTIVYVIGLLSRSQQTVHGIGLDSLQVIALYFATIAGLFVFR